MCEAAFNEGEYDAESYEFKKFVEEAETPLFEDSEHTKLEALVKLHNLKARFGLSDTCFSEFLDTVGSLLPKDNVLPQSTYEAKKTLANLGLELIIRKQPVKKIKKKPGNVRSLFGANELPSSVPKRCKLLYKHVKDVMGKTNEALRTVLDDQVFGIERQLYILRENILDFLEMKQIGQGVLAAYMAYLHDFLKEKDQLEVFAFVDPEATFQPERDEFQPYLLNRLREGKSDRIFFIPYNPKEHWILTVLWENEIDILDSLSRPHPYRQWENIVISVVKQFNAKTGRTGKPRVTRLHGVAEQVGGVECGYYVMQFMKEIVNDETLSFPTKWAGKKRKPYDQSKIDEVRLEVTDYIQALL